MNLVLTTVLKNLILHLNSSLCIRIVHLFKETEKETLSCPTRPALSQVLRLSTSAPGDTMLKEAVVTCYLPGTALGNGVGGEIHPLRVGAVQVTADCRETGISRNFGS